MLFNIVLIILVALCTTMARVVVRSYGQNHSRPATLNAILHKDEVVDSEIQDDSTDSCSPT